MARKTITVGIKSGKPNPNKTTIAIGGTDTVILKNNFSSNVQWVVPDGPFLGGAVDEVVHRGKSSSEKKTVKVRKTKAYVYQVFAITVAGKRKKRRVLNDPVIIIDP